MRLRRILLWCFLGSLAATGVTGIVALLFDLPQSERIVGSAALVAAYSLGALACAALIARDRSVIASWGALAILGAGLLVWLSLIWFEQSMTWEQSQTLAKIGATATIAGVSALQFAFLSQLGVRWLISHVAWIGGCVFAWGAGLIGVLLLWEVIDGSEEIVRFLGGMLILASLGSFAAPLLSYLERMARTPDDGAGLERHVPVRLACPACAAECVGQSNRREACPSCQLLVKIEIDEPRCECGYLLYGLKSEVCPECGKPIPSDLRWPAQEVADEREVAG